MGIVTRWNKGSDTIERLLDSRHLERVPADTDTVAALIGSAGRHVTSATTTAADDPEGAFTLAYDAARKTATALLAHQGLRPTSAGGHVVIVEAMYAQLPGVAGLKSIDRLRCRRNRAEYPDPRTTTRSRSTRSATPSRSLERASRPLRR